MSKTPTKETAGSPTAASPTLEDSVNPSDSFAFMTAAAARRRRKEKEEKELEELGNGGQENLESVVKMPRGLDGYLQCMERDCTTGDYKLRQEFQYTKTFWSIPEEQELPDPPITPVNQLDVFRIVGEPIIKYAFAGFNNCVFAYGQTGSGKTHTMTGDFEVMPDGEFSEQTGLIPRLCRKLFETIEERKKVTEDGIVKTFDVQLNAIEIYNEQVRDLFWRSTPGRVKNTVLQVRMHPTEGAFVDLLTVLHPKDWRDCIRKIDKGISERTVASTLMNDESSRSHSVFQIILTQTETVHVRSDDPEDRFSKPVTYKKVSKINLVDLAGSERNKKTGAAGQQLKEASNINQSLFTLKKVIDSLVTNSKEPNPKKHVAVPFRESTLTRLLSDSLGGNSKTTMIACVSPHFDNQEETLLTLQYANRTGAIVNNTRVNEDSAAKQALELKHHILELQKRLAEGPVDEEAEELLDQIEVGRRSLKEMEEETVRTEKEFAEVQSQAKEVEGALYAAALHNMVDMAYSQFAKETEDARLAELQKSLAEAKSDHEALKRRMFEVKRSEENDSKRLEQLRASERAISDVYTSSREVLESLQREKKKADDRAEKEEEFTIAQRKANEEGATQMNAKMENEINNSHAEQERKLSRVILKAAEDYELQVRDFADFETSQQHKIKRLEAENAAIKARIAACESDSFTTMTLITNAAAERSRRLGNIEDEWKQKYETKRAEYQTRILEIEHEMASQDKAQMQVIDEMAERRRKQHFDLTTDMSAKIILAESEWQQIVDECYDAHADNIDRKIRQLDVDSHQRAINTRRECEETIRTLYAQLDRIRYVEGRYETVLEQLRRVLQTMGGLHDDLMQDAPHDASRDLKMLKARLRRFDDKVASSPVRVRGWGGGAGVGVGLNSSSAANVNASSARSSPSRPILADLSGVTANANRSTMMGGTTPTTSAKIFNVFSKERFDAMNARRFGPPRMCATAAAIDESVATSLAQHINSGLSTPMNINNNNYRSPTPGARRGVFGGAPISLLGGPAAASPSLQRPTLVPTYGNTDLNSAVPARSSRAFDPNSSAPVDNGGACMTPRAAAEGGRTTYTYSNNDACNTDGSYPAAAPTTPRRINLPENVPTPKGSLHVRVQQQQFGGSAGSKAGSNGVVMRSAPVRGL